MRTLLALLLCSVAWGADLKLVASPATAPAANTPVPLDAGKFIFLSIPDYAGDITFDPPDSPLVSMFPVAQGLKFPGCKQGDEKAGEHTVPVSKSTVYAVFGEKAGVLTVSAWGVNGSKAVKISTITIAVGGARPPPPDPKPDPKPDPQPFVGKWRILIVEETADAANNRGQFLSDKSLNDYIHAKCSSKPRIVDQNVTDSTGLPPKDMAPWLAMAKGKKPPQVFLVSEDGTILFFGDLPSTPANFLILLKSIGG